MSPRAGTRRRAVVCLTVMLTVWSGSVAAGSAEAGGEGESEEGVVFSPEVEAILNQTPDGEDYGAMEKCIQSRSIRGTQVLDDRHVVFEMPSRKYYLVQFRHACHRLRPDVTITYESRGSQLCRMDFIRAFDSFTPGSLGPPCSIPGFHPVTREQIALLKDSLKARRKAEVEAIRAEKEKRKAEKQAEKAAQEEGGDAGR